MSRDTDIFAKAKAYAFDKHDKPSDSQRYGNAPYSKHLMDVFGYGKKYIEKYIETELRDDVMCALILHDTIEDTDTSPSKLQRLFNRRVADIVFRVSNERGFDRKEKNFKTYPKIWPNDLAIFVKLSDRLANTYNSKTTGHRMYDVYKNEYPVFRYALNVRGLYPDMWKELDDLYEYKDE